MRRAVRLGRRYVGHGGEIAGGEAGGEAQRARGIDHQKREVAAAAVPEFERLERRLHPLGLATTVEEAVVDAFGQTLEEFEGRDLAVRGQEPARPLGDRVVGPAIGTMDAMGKVGPLLGVVDGKEGRGIVEIGMSGAGG